MSGIERVTWQPVCCADHDGYAEHPLRGGGVARLFRALDGSLSITRFGPDNRPVDHDGAGVPVSVPMEPDEIAALLA